MRREERLLLVFAVGALALYLFGFFFWKYHPLERLAAAHNWPGLFDLTGGSHLVWHLATWAGAMVWDSGLRLLMERSWNMQSCPV